MQVNETEAGHFRSVSAQERPLTEQAAHFAAATRSLAQSPAKSWRPRTSSLLASSRAAGAPQGEPPKTAAKPRETVQAHAQIRSGLRAHKLLRAELWDAGAVVGIHDFACQRALQEAFILGRPGAIGVLLDKQIVRDQWDQLVTPLVFEAISSHRAPALVECAIKKGFDVEQISAGGPTPLTWAVRHGRLDIIVLLLHHKARINHPDGNGRTPLGDALWGRKINASLLLLSHGARAFFNRCWHGAS